MKYFVVLGILICIILTACITEKTRICPDETTIVGIEEACPEKPEGPLSTKSPVKEPDILEEPLIVPESQHTGEKPSQMDPQTLARRDEFLRRVAMAGNVHNYQYLDERNRETWVLNNTWALVFHLVTVPIEGDAGPRSRILPQKPLRAYVESVSADNRKMPVSVSMTGHDINTKKIKGRYGWLNGSLLRSGHASASDYQISFVELFESDWPLKIPSEWLDDAKNLTPSEIITDRIIEGFKEPVILFRFENATIIEMVLGKYHNLPLRVVRQDKEGRLNTQEYRILSYNWGCADADAYVYDIAKGIADNIHPINEYRFESVECRKDIPTW